MSTATTAEREMVVTRVIAAPRELVFDAFTDPAHIADWWGPNGFTTTTHARDVRVGGVWRFTMHGPDGTNYNDTITYREISRPDRIVYFHEGDAEQNLSFETTITFKAVDGGTRLSLRTLFDTVEIRDEMRKFGAVEGGQQTLARLEAYLTSASGP